MISTQIVQTSVNVILNSPSQEYTHQTIVLHFEFVNVIHTMSLPFILYILHRLSSQKVNHMTVKIVLQECKHFLIFTATTQKLIFLKFLSRCSVDVSKCTVSIVFKSWAYSFLRKCRFKIAIFSHHSKSFTLTLPWHLTGCGDADPHNSLKSASSA